MQKNFTYSGWEIVDGKPVYLSDSRSDCKCGITIPKILPEEISTIWQEDLKIILLLIGKTGSLKTSTCETFAEPFNEGAMLRFESTAVALENYREECIDQIMIVDDIFKKDSASMKKMEAINRAFGDGIGRAKSTVKDYKEISR